MAAARNGELEIGATEILRRHPTVHLAADHAHPVPPWILRFEAARPRMLRECIAEAYGVFCFTYGGVSALACFILTTAAQEAGFGSILNVAFGFAFGIAFALITSARTSGGHFHPAMSIAFALFRDFPWKKVPFYIISQIFGGFFACVIVYAQWGQQIKAYEAELTAAGETLISATGPAGIFCAIPVATQSIGYLFLTEWFVDTFIAVIIWAVLDPGNHFVAPASAPFVIGLAYFTMIIGYGANTIATNTGRDLGARMFAAALYGKGVFTIKNGYAAIAILTNIPATIFGIAFYQFVMFDSKALIAKGHALPEEVHRKLVEEREKSGDEVSHFERELRKRATKQEGGMDTGMATEVTRHEFDDPLQSNKRNGYTFHQESV